MNPWAVKDKGTRKLQSVDWHFDHNQGRVVRGGNHVVLRIHWGRFIFPCCGVCIASTTVRDSTAGRKATKRLRYRSKLD